MSLHLTGTLWHMLDDQSLDAIADAALRLLTKSGARIEHNSMLARLEAAGCHVDRSAQRCYFSEKLLTDAVTAFSPKDNRSSATVPGHWHRNLRLRQTGSHPHLLEWPHCRRRLATAQDVRDMVKLAHVADDFDTVGQALTCAQIAPAVEPIWNAVTRMELTNKPLSGGEVLYPQTVPYLAELERIYGGGKKVYLMANCDFAIAPLIFSARAVGCMIEKSRCGVSHAPGTMPISGMSAPVTIAGTAAIATAELLAGWAMYFLLDPALETGGAVCSGALDMRTSQACFGSPQALLQNIATVEVCRRKFGMMVWPAVNYADGKTPGIRTTYEKMLPLIAAPMIGYGNLMSDGLLSAGQDYCPVQHLLELDFLRGLGRFCDGFEVNAQTLAVELMEQVIRGQHDGFLETDHTMAHFRAEQWYPKWLEHSAWAGDAVEQEAEAKLLDRMAAYCREAIAKYEPPKVDQEKLGAAKELLKRAEVELKDVAAKR
ncbi:MAG: trimethylamine methyltransferase family protein [Phycisphaeraceae bacterium]|nr:trimethylamine methyltransferase family protein [Phycisphaeraceae bacterium]